MRCGIRRSASAPRLTTSGNLNPPNGNKRKGTPIIDLNQEKMEKNINLVEIIGKSIKIKEK
jgi:hypothetical protein